MYTGRRRPTTRKRSTTGCWKEACYTKYQKVRKMRCRHGPEGRQEGRSGSVAGLHVGMVDIIDYFGRTSGIDADMYAAADRVGEGDSMKEAFRDIAEKSVLMARYLLATDGQDLLGMREWKHSRALSCDIPEQVFCRVLRIVGGRNFQNGFFGERIRRLGASQAVAYLLTSVAGDSMRHSGTR